jgi:hypothetical protein
MHKWNAPVAGTTVRWSLPARPRMSRLKKFAWLIARSARERRPTEVARRNARPSAKITVLADKKIGGHLPNCQRAKLIIVALSSDRTRPRRKNLTRKQAILNRLPTERQRQSYASTAGSQRLQCWNLAISPNWPYPIFPQPGILPRYPLFEPRSPHRRQIVTLGLARDKKQILADWWGDRLFY